MQVQGYMNCQHSEVICVVLGNEQGFWSSAGQFIRSKNKNNEEIFYKQGSYTKKNSPIEKTHWYQLQAKMHWIDTTQTHTKVIVKVQTREVCSLMKTGDSVWL